MRLITYNHPATGNSSRAGVLQGDRILDVNGLTEGKVNSDMLRILDHWDESHPVVAAAAETFAREFEDVPQVPTNVAVPVWEATLGPPLPEPRSFRDFYAFEQHVAAGFAKRDRPVPDAWYETPVFYFGNHGSFVGPDQPVAKPESTRELDFEMEIAAVIGRGGRDIESSSAFNHIAGFCLLNDWSARDVQRRETSVGLGPAKGKDFATSLGPWMVTVDELADVLVDGRLNLDVAVRINGDQVGESNVRSMHWSFGDLIATASRDADLRPGDVLASGTMPSGCLLELGSEVHPWLDHDDEVEIESARLGRLRNRIV